MKYGYPYSHVSQQKLADEVDRNLELYTLVKQLGDVKWLKEINHHLINLSNAQKRILKLE